MKLNERNTLHEIPWQITISHQPQLLCQEFRNEQLREDTTPYIRQVYKKRLFNQKGYFPSRDTMQMHG